MQVDVISGTCRSSSLLSSRINSETTLGSQVRSEEMEGDTTAAAASSSILMASNNGSVSTTANEATSGSMQAGVISASSSTVMSSRNVSEATIPNKGMSDEKQADVFSGASLTLMTSSDDPVSTFANKQGTQAGDASVGSSTLVTSRYNSTAVEITSTLASANFQEQHEEAFTDDEMFRFRMKMEKVWTGSRPFRNILELNLLRNLILNLKKVVKASETISVKPMIFS